MATPSSPAERLGVATAATRSHLDLVRVLAGSLAEHHPELRLLLVLTDEPSGGIPTADEPFDVLPVAALGIEDLDGLRRRHDAHSLAGNAKPWALRRLLDTGHDAALYLDADAFVLGDLEPLLAAVRRHALVLTPHLTAPEPAERELYVLRAGAYNAGVVGVRDTPEARGFLDWWDGRIRAHPGTDLAFGRHNDQRWLDFAPGFVADLHVLRHPAINVGQWALPGRIEEDPHPRLLHFSGFDPHDPERVSRHAAGLPTADLGPVASVFREYARRLLAAGHDELRGRAGPGA